MSIKPIYFSSSQSNKLPKQNSKRNDKSVNWFHVGKESTNSDYGHISEIDNTRSKNGYLSRINYFIKNHGDRSYCETFLVVIQQMIESFREDYHSPHSNLNEQNFQLLTFLHSDKAVSRFLSDVGIKKISSFSVYQKELATEKINALEEYLKPFKNNFGESNKVLAICANGSMNDQQFFARVNNIGNRVKIVPGVNMIATDYSDKVAELVQKIGAALDDDNVNEIKLNGYSRGGCEMIDALAQLIKMNKLPTVKEVSIFLELPTVFNDDIQKNNFRIVSKWQQQQKNAYMAIYVGGMNSSIFRVKTIDYMIEWASHCSIITCHDASATHAINRQIFASFELIYPELKKAKDYNKMQLFDIHIDDSNMVGIRQVNYADLLKFHHDGMSLRGLMNFTEKLSSEDCPYSSYVL